MSAKYPNNNTTNKDQPSPKTKEESMSAQNIPDQYMEVIAYPENDLNSSERHKQISIQNSEDYSLKDMNHQFTIQGIENNK